MRVICAIILRPKHFRSEHFLARGGQERGGRRAAPLPAPTASPHCQPNPRSHWEPPLPAPLPIFTVRAPTVSPTARIRSGYPTVSPHCQIMRT